jgi:DNA-binding CsgD family transcriptional regulator
MRNHNEVLFTPPRSARARQDEVVEIIRQNPGISKGEIAQRLYLNPLAKNGLGGMLTQLCYVQRIKYQDVHRYSVVDAE